MVVQQTVDYYPSPLELTSRTHPFIFLWNSKEFISQELFVFLIFLKPVYPTIYSKFMVLRLLKKIFVSQKMLVILIIFQTKISPRFFSSSFRQKEITQFLQGAFF